MKKPQAKFVMVVVLLMWALGSYLMTAAPTFYNLDSAEFAIGVHTLGIVHATGYPLYILLGRILTHILPFKDLGYEMNILSALYATLTLINVVLIIHQLYAKLERKQDWVVWGGIAAALSLGFSYYFWASAVVAEVYTFQTWLLSSALGSLLRWEETSKPHWLTGFALFYGLCFANHISVVLTLPGILWYFAHRYSHLAKVGKHLWLSLTTLGIGPAFYIYFPLRYQKATYNLAGYYNNMGEFIPVDLGSWRGLWWLVSGQMFHSMALGYSGQELLTEAGRFLHQFWGNFLGVGIIVGLVGLFALWRQRRVWLISWLLMFIAHAAFFINYQAADKAMMFLPCYLLWTFFVGVGLIEILTWNTTVGDLPPALNIGWILLIVSIIWSVNYTYVDVSQDYRARKQAQIFLDTAAPNALVVGWWTDITPIQYLQHVEGQRPDVQSINRLMISEENLIHLLMERRERHPVYILQEGKFYPLQNQVLLPGWIR